MTVTRTRSGLGVRLLGIGLAPALIILLTAIVAYAARERSFASSSSLTQSRNVIGQNHAAQLDPEALRLPDRVRAGSQRMAALIDDLLQLSTVARAPVHSDEDVPGTGIGLATLRRAVVRHGGSVAAQGRPGQGATMAFSFDQRPAAA